MIGKVNENAPGVLTNTNAWYYSALKYIDWAEMAYSGKMAFWSNKGDESDMTLTREFDFSSASGPLCHLPVINVA